MAKPLEQHTRADQTKYLSREFLLGLAVNLLVLVGGGFYAFGKLEAKAEAVPEAVTALQSQVAVLESKTIDVQRVAKLEEAMSNMTRSMERLQASLDRNFYAPSPRK